MALPKALQIFGQTAPHSELSMEPDIKLLDGSRLEPKLEESEESKESGTREVVMYPNACSCRGRNSPALFTSAPTDGIDGMTTTTPAKPSSSMPMSIPTAGSGEDEPMGLLTIVMAVFLQTLC